MTIYLDNFAQFRSDLVETVPDRDGVCFEIPTPSRAGVVSFLLSSRRHRVNVIELRSSFRSVCAREIALAHQTKAYQYFISLVKRDECLQRAKRRILDLVRRLAVSVFPRRGHLHPIEFQISAGCCWPKSRASYQPLLLSTSREMKLLLM